ncbi:transcription factor bHLH94-like [Euphorbia lathyris]|uniref:transcription factor bHLH94-like n=1 Tax=Euphorbia lathyris TaxID=212925 RepID=UPI0033140D61
MRLESELFDYSFNNLDEEIYNETAYVSALISSSSMGLPHTTTAPAESPATVTSAGRRKRQRVKNKEEVEHERMTHIAVERNRRKQMNHYLSILRSIMPPSYVLRGDQASIVGGAINFVKELEQLLESLEAHKTINKQTSDLDFSNNVEVTMVESHVNLKILLRRQPKLLLKMMTGLCSLSLTILHINVTTFHHMLLFSFSVKMEDECKMSSVNEISAAVYEMVARFQEETVSN